MRNFIPFLLLLPFTLLCTGVSAQCPVSLVINSDDDVITFVANAPANCTFLTGDLTISGPDVTDVSGLSILTNISGNVLVEGTRMSYLDGLQNLTTIGGDFTIRDCGGLTGNGLQEGAMALSRLSGYLSLSNLPRLTEFLPLTNLGILSSGFGSNAIAISNLAPLSGLSGSMARLELTNNPALTDLTALTGIALIDVGMVISGNTALSSCAIAPVCATLPDGNTATIFGNAAGCESVPVVSLACGIPCDDPVYDALEAFYNQANGDDWTDNTNWLDNCDPCTWFGVSCNGDGEVVGLDLPANGLVGTIAPQLGSITTLGRIDLGENTLSGNVPSSIWDLPLTYLDLNTNGLGTIADAGNMPLLEYVSLFNNNFSTSDLPIITGAPNLTAFLARDAGFVGQVPTTYNPTEMPALEELDLSNNNLFDYLPPAWGGFTNLDVLNLRNNNFIGCYPEVYANLCQVNVNFNLNADLPDGGSIAFFLNAFCEQRDLCEPDCHPDYEPLVAFYNAMNGDDWSNNTGWLTDCEPCSWFGVNCNGSGRVSNLSLFNNNLNGSLPAEIGQLSALISLSLPNNRVSGTLPSEINQLTGLLILNMQMNGLVSPLPELTGLTALTSLNLSSNGFTGTIPVWINQLTALKAIGLSGNLFTGPIPDLSALTSMELLGFGFNQLTGELPEYFGEYPALTGLRLENNNFTGCYPATYDALCPLTNVRFTNNPGLPGGGSTDFFEDVFCATGQSCEGPCHPDFDALMGFYAATNGADWNVNTGWADGAAGTDCSVCGWQGVTCNGNGRVVFIDLFANNLTGTLPAVISSFDELRRLNLSINNIGGTVPGGLNQLSDLRTLDLSSNDIVAPLPNLNGLTRLQAIDLSNNELTGMLPGWLNEITNLRDVRFIDNGFTGPLPDLSGMVNLTSLRLSDNNFSGELPAYLGDLPLGALRLEFNSFTGCYPANFSSLCDEGNINFSDNPGLPDGGSIDFFENTFCVSGENCSVLPVTWLTFTAGARGKVVALDWATAEERGSSHFAVERSADGGDWTEIGHLAAAGEASVRNDYSFTDGQPLTGANYYRIRQVDLDGTADLSLVRVVSILPSTAARVFPNPTSGDFTIVTNETQLVSLYAADGRLLREIRHSGGGAQVQRGDLEPGLYWLRFGETGEVMKVVVR